MADTDAHRPPEAQAGVHIDHIKMKGIPVHPTFTIALAQHKYRDALAAAKADRSAREARR